MKIIRSTKCSLKFATEAKQKQLSIIMDEYQRSVNLYINKFWKHDIAKRDLLNSNLNLIDTWFSQRMKQNAAREALDMISSAIEKDGDLAIKPRHYGKRMCLNSNIIDCQNSETEEFDLWLHFSNIGNKINFKIPIKKHKHFNDYELSGTRCNSYIVTEEYVQFSFEIETGPKKEVQQIVGLDVGINALASLSNREQYGVDIRADIDRVNRCQHGSKGQLRASRSLRNKLAIEAKKIVSSGPDLIVVEKLKNITRGTKGKKVKTTRKLLGRWNVRYFQDRVKQGCEVNRVSFRSVSPAYTSQTCASCGSVGRGNRNGDRFVCLRCGHEDNADINAAINIRDRFLTGKYGSCYKTLVMGGQE